MVIFSTPSVCNDILLPLHVSIYLWVRKDKTTCEINAAFLVNGNMYICSWSIVHSGVVSKRKRHS